MSSGPKRWLLLVILATLLLLPSAAAEQVTLSHEDTVVTVAYDPLFEIGEIWYLDFNVSNGDGYRIEAELAGATARSRDLPDHGDSSLSFPGSTFAGERFNVEFELRLVHAGDDTVEDTVTVEIDVNQPPASDLVYLWAAMTVFWVGVGGYAAWLHRRQQALAAQLKAVLEDEARE